MDRPARFRSVCCVNAIEESNRSTGLRELTGVKARRKRQMKILVVGGGGREHAICWKLAQSPKVEKLYCAPGNAGIAEVAECVNIGVMDFEKLVAFAKENEIDLTVVAPDDPLAAGAVDAFEAAGLRAFGPRKMRRSSRDLRHFLRI